MNVSSQSARAPYTGMAIPKPIEEIFADIVYSVSQRILPQLVAADANITKLTSMYGHPLELKNKLREKSDSSLRKEKFPVVMLFADVKKSSSTVRGGFFDVELEMIIAMSTEANYDTSKRIATNFVPILRPIHKELVRQIFKSGYFWVQSERQLLSIAPGIERLYWGKEGIQGNTQNEFEDYIDAIHIKGLRLTQTKQGTTISQNTFMQFVDYFLSETRATITVATVTDNKITNTFFLNHITQIETDKQTYIKGVDFTQTLDVDGKPTGELVGVNLEFYVGQTLVAWR